MLKPLVPRFRLDLNYPFKKYRRKTSPREAETDSNILITIYAAISRYGTLKTKQGNQL